MLKLDVFNLMNRFARTSWLVAGVLTGSAGCAINIDREGYIEHEQKRFDAPATVDLHLTTFDGAIEIRSWDKAEVVIDVEKRGQDKRAVSKIEIIASRDGNRIDLEARHPGTGGSFIGFVTSPRTKLIASVPRKTNLVIHTGDGSVFVERVDGRIELKTGDGSIRTVETSGQLLAESGDGSIHLDDVSGRVEARTDDGSLRITGTPGVLRARSGDGSIVLRIRRGTVMTEDWMVATGDGSISAELPNDFNADIEADPGSDGHARSELNLLNISGGTRDHRQLRGRLGEGGRTFVLRTGDGTIRLTPY